MCGIARAIIYIILYRRKKFYLKLCRNRHFVYFKGGDLLACTACSGEEARGAGPAAGPVGADADPDGVWGATPQSPHPLLQAAHRDPHLGMGGGGQRGGIGGCGEEEGHGMGSMGVNSWAAIHKGKPLGCIPGEGCHRAPVCPFPVLLCLREDGA